MIIQGKIGLRAIEDDDLEQLRDWRNQPHFRKNFREVKELGMYNQRAWLTKVNQSSNDYMFAILELENNRLIGAGGLLYIDWILRSADFSIYIGEKGEYLNSEGYGGDAAKGLLEYGFNFLNMNKIWMELYEYDNAKIDFFTKKMGFKIDGKLRQNCFYKGAYYDSLIISLLATEYHELTNSNNNTLTI